MQARGRSARPKLLTSRSTPTPNQPDPEHRKPTAGFLLHYIFRKIFPGQGDGARCAPGKTDGRHGSAAAFIGGRGWCGAVASCAVDS
ncbi:unnamed protein product [Leptosia nina]|uniref:Uncharacterized protein n=1 Tax=Leptosia nina TaxID=320188 RepID=A0AAV1JRC9_9NEOP